MLRHWRFESKQKLLAYPKEFPPGIGTLRHELAIPLFARTGMFPMLDDPAINVHCFLVSTR